MSILTPAQLALYNTQPHRTKLWLSVYQPDTVLACQVNDAAITREAITITYDNVTEGNFALVKSGMTLYIGTSPGAFDKGKLRVRAATATTLTVAENVIQWADDDYLTVISFFEITAVYPRNIQNPDNELDVIFYKDYNIAYTDQNTINGAFICMGSHYAGFLENGSHQVYYDATGTAHVNSGVTIDGYSWFFEGATTTGSFVATPGYVEYDTPGHYTTRLTVSGSNGSVDVSYRHISIYDRPTEGTNVPILNWMMTPLSGSRDNGGYATDITVHDVADSSIFVDGALIVIFAEDWYGDTKQSIGTNSVNRESIVFVGYIVEDTIKWNWRDSDVTFTVASPTEIMKLSEGFSIEVDDEDNPLDSAAGPIALPPWAVMPSMTVKKSIWHYLNWHSTVLLCTDVEYKGDSYPLQYFTSDKASLYDALKTHYNSTMFGSAVNDRQGKLWLEIDMEAIEDSANQFPVTFALNTNHWMDEPDISEVINTPVNFIELGGIAYSGSTGTYAAFLSGAPGVGTEEESYQLKPYYRGSSMVIQGLALQSQSQLNQLCGNVLAYRNARYPDSTFELTGNYRNMDIAPQELLSISLTETDTVRGISFTDKLFHIREMIWSYQPREENFLPTISVHEITNGFDGETIPIPDLPPNDWDTPGPGDIPIWDWPPDIPWIPPTETSPVVLVAYDLLSGLYYYDDDSQWNAVNMGGVNAGDIGDVLAFATEVRDTNQIRCYLIARDNRGGNIVSTLYRKDDITDSQDWTQLNQFSVPNVNGNVETYYGAVGVNPNDGTVLVFVGQDPIGTLSPPFVQKLQYSTDNGDSFSDGHSTSSSVNYTVNSRAKKITYSGNDALCTFDYDIDGSGNTVAVMWYTDDDGATVTEDTVSTPNRHDYSHAWAGVTVYSYIANASGIDEVIYQGSAGSIGSNVFADGGNVYQQSIGYSNGNILAVYANPAEVIRSTDDGSSFELKAQPLTLPRCVEATSNKLIWYLGGDSGIYKTTDAGDSWSDIRNGDLTGTVDILQIEAIE